MMIHLAFGRCRWNVVAPQEGGGSFFDEAEQGFLAADFRVEIFQLSFDFAEGQNTKISANSQNTDVNYFHIFKFVLNVLRIREIPRTFHEN